MEKLMRLLVLVLCIIGFIGLFVPSAAQESGGTIVYGKLIGDPFAFSGSNMFCTSNDCSVLAEGMYIDLIGVDPETGWFGENESGALVESWEFANGNQVLTLHLRDDLYWSDGVPITAADVMMNYELRLHPETNIDGELGVRRLNTTITNVESLDEHTIRITFAQGSCNSLSTINGDWKVVPAHIYHQLLDEVGYEGLRNHEWFQHPTVVSGPFRFGEIGADNSVTLLPNETYHDNALGYVAPERFKQIPVPTESMTVEDFLASEANVIQFGARPDSQAFLDADAVGLLQAYQYPFNNFHFLALNQADPNNPQPALDENGQRIEQGLHPIFGDKLTRQAIARAIDVDAIIEATLGGFGTRLTTHVIPNSWAINSDLAPVPYDPQLALAMLAEAGWTPENPDLPAGPDNRLICRNCLYAREVDALFNGTYMEFKIPNYQPPFTEVEMIAEQLTAIGITVHVEEAEWDAVVSDLVGQTFDATSIGIVGAYPYNPVTDDFFGPLADVPDSGFNFSSFYNEAYFALEATANSVPGCGLTERANIYRQMQEIMYDEQPFIFMYANTGMYVAKNEVEGFAPYPNDLFWNVDTWVVHEAD